MQLQYLIVSARVRCQANVLFLNANEWFFCECNRWIRILWWSQTSPYFKGKKKSVQEVTQFTLLESHKKCLWAVICSHLVLWQQTKVRHMMSRTTKDVPAFWLFCLLPSLCYLQMWRNPQKNFCLYICYIAQLHAGGGIKGSISQVKKHGDKLSNYASIITWNMFW